MKRQLIMLVFSLCCSKFSAAQTIDSSHARSVADNFCKQKTKNLISNIALVYTDKTPIGDTSLYFIYNINQNDGWIIVSADEAAVPILGYSLSGHYLPQNQSPEFLFWMDRYKKEMLYIKQNKVQPTEDIKTDWDKYRLMKGKENTQNNSNIVSSGVGPLLSTIWGQGEFYNANCPTPTPTGCVATAMAQIMKYWNYPEQGKGSYSYTDPISRTPDRCNSTIAFPSYGLQSANFENTVYGWSCMPSDIYFSSSSVATLMYHCGVSVNMDYAPDGSGAWVLTDDEAQDCNGSTYHQFSAQHAYTTYFRYSSTSIQGILQKNYNTTSWSNKLKTELNAGRPIQYAAWDNSNNTAHSWVCDGYDGDNKFHMNWGWRGTSNGFYHIGYLNPSNTNSHFNDNDEALVGIKPSLAYPDCPNDECINAITLANCEKRIVNNFRATTSLSAPNISCYSGSIQDVWFKINPTSASLTVETYQLSCGLTDLVMQAFSGTCGNLHQIDCDDDSGDGNHAKITFTNLTNQNPIYIRVTDKGGNDFGEFGIVYKQTALGSPIFSPTQFISGDGSHVLQYPTLSGDVNGDKKTDLIFIFQNTSGLGIRTKMSNGDGTYTAYAQMLPDGAGVHEYPTLTGDVNGDGKTDLIFIFQTINGLVIRTKMSNGDGTYTPYAQMLPDGAAVHQYPTLTGDVNGDGKTDLIFIFQTTNGLVIRTKMSNGNGTYTPYAQILPDGAGVHQYPTLTGDVNGDGKTDLIFIFQTTNGLVIRTKMSNGDGTFKPYAQILPDGAGVHQYPTLTGDVNGDGKTDLIFTFQHTTNGLTIRTKMSNGDGTFTPYQQVMGDGAGVHDYPALTGDVDGDGKTDLIFTGQNWINCGLNIRVKRSNGDGTWCAKWQGMADGSGVHQYPTFSGDANADGKTDLIYVFQDNTQGLILRTKISQATNLCQPGSIIIPQPTTDAFIVYPNPTNGLVQIAANDPGEFEVNIFDMNGRVLFPVQKFTTSVQVDLSAFSSGIYFADIYDTTTRQRVRKKIVLMR